MSTERAIDEIVNDVPVCGCGNSEAMWKIVEAMLARAEEHRGGGKSASFYDAMPELDLSAHAVQFIAHVLGERPARLLEHGTSIGWAWLTDDGETLLKYLREHPGFDGRIDAAV